MLFEPHWLKYHLPAPFVSGVWFFGRILLRLSRTMRPQVMSMVKFSPITLNFGYDFVLLVHLFRIPFIFIRYSVPWPPYCTILDLVLALESYCTTVLVHHIYNVPHWYVKLLPTVNVERRVESVTSTTVTWKSVELGILGKIYQSARWGQNPNFFQKLVGRLPSNDNADYLNSSNSIVDHPGVVIPEDEGRRLCDVLHNTNLVK